MKVGLCKCNGKLCEVCKNILKTDTYTFSNDQTTYIINHKFDCNKNCLVYLTQPAITCSKLTIETLEQGVKFVQS